MLAMKGKWLVSSLATLFFASALFVSVSDTPVTQGARQEQDQAQALGKMSFQVAPGLHHETGKMELGTVFRYVDNPQSNKDNIHGTMMKDSVVTNVVNAIKLNTNSRDLQVEIVSPSQHVASKDTVSAIAKQNDRQGHRVAAAFNADFFDVPTGIPLGLQITAGELVTTPAGSSSTFLAVMPDRTVRIGRTAQVEVYIRTQSGARFELNGVNKLLKKNSANTALLMTDKFGGSTLSENAVISITIAPKEQDAKVLPGKVLSGVVESMEAGDNKPIPAGKWLLTANGTKAEWLRQNIKVGETISLNVSIGNDLNSALYAVGGFNHRFADVLLHKGEVPKELLDLADKNNFERHPRTIFATKGTELHVFVVDGRQEGYSDGISVMDAAGYLQGLGMEEAINVDGGGSSTYAVRKPGDSSLTLLNRPSDGKEREIGNALLIVSTASER